MTSRRRPSRPGEETLSELLLRLWQFTRTEFPEAFPEKAMEALRDAIPADGALWGYATVAGAVLKVHSVHLADVPAEALVEYERVKNLDPVVRRAVLEPGRSFSFAFARASRNVDPRWMAFNRRWGLHAISTVMRFQPYAKLAMFTSLYRNSRSRPFLPGERRMHEAFAPHLQAAHEMVLMRGIERTPEHAAPGMSGAVVDHLGRLHRAESAFEELLHREWPAWTGPTLPDDLVPLAAGSGSFKGRAVVVSAGKGVGDLSTLWARRRTTVDDLSPREREVATLFAEGLESKEIARRLGISPATVRNRIQDVYGNLQIGDRVALQRALRGG